MDENGDDRPDAGEEASLSVVVANKGTVTLGLLNISDSINSAGCAASATFLLRQGEQHECTPVQQVSTVLNRTVLCSIHTAILRKGLDGNSSGKQARQFFSLLQPRGAFSYNTTSPL